MASKSSGNILSYVVFLSTLSVILLSLVSVIFPALIIRTVSPVETGLDPFESGPWVPLLISNVILFGFGIGYYKKRLPKKFSQTVEFVLNFEISKKTALIIAITLLSIYIGLSVGELSLNEEEEWVDYIILKEALKTLPFGEHEDVYVKEQTERYVRMFLLWSSLNVFQNIKILPFVASILLVIVTYFLTYQISQKRFAGIISMVILLQSYTFLRYDTIAVYENFWALFYILSLYAVYKKWYFSPISYMLSVFTKAFAVLYFPMSIFFIYRAKIHKRRKIVIIASYGIVVAITVGIFLAGESIFGEIIRIDFTEFLIGLTSWSYQLRFDYLMILTILPLSVGLLIRSKQGIKEADSILVLILGGLLAGPILVMFTDFYYILPYRFVPLVVFFAIGIGVLFSKKQT